MKMSERFAQESDYTICAVDTETSGLRPGLHEILSMCIMPLNDKFEPLGIDFLVRIKAMNPCDPKALEVNKLDPTVGMSRSEAHTKLKEWRKKYGIVKIVPLGHNINFDLPFIMMLFPRPEDFRDMFHYHNRDTMAIAQVINDLCIKKNLPKRFNSVSLAKVANALGIDSSSAHSTQGDCAMTVAVYNKMMGMLSI